MSKPIFEQPAGYRFRADGVQMSLDWQTNFGAEKTAALQKAQFATAQKAAALIDQYVPFDTGILKNSVNQASKFDEGLLEAAINNYKLMQMYRMDRNDGRADMFVSSFIDGVDWKDEVASLDLSLIHI